MFGVCCALCVVRCWLCVCWLPVVCYVMCVANCLLFGCRCCVLFDMCCWLCAVRGVLCDACCLLFVCLLRAACGLLCVV